MVTAARRLIGRAKVSSSTKKRILSCVSRKASSMGCGKSDSTEKEALEANCNNDGYLVEVEDELDIVTKQLNEAKDQLKRILDKLSEYTRKEDYLRSL